ncbi:MAG: amidohydrolase [Solirubrobacteraceae bacterium MAG38_C4-C5]|nr:amidohydrolase [Candidatus Siliceabacter maunaloa]
MSTHPTSTLLSGACVLTMDPTSGAEPVRRDILIKGDRIEAVEPSISPERANEVVDLTDRLVMPGLVNAHLHSWEALFKGRYDNLPLELWMLFAYPILGLSAPSRRLIELRSLLVAIESLRNGVTCIVDDVIEMPDQTTEALDAVFRAYEAAGIRANVSGNVLDRPIVDSLPFAADVLPPELLARGRSQPHSSPEDYLAFSEDALARWHGHEGRLRYVIAPSGPQRCTDDLLVAAEALSRRHDTTYHIHVLETKTQAVTGHELYGKTLVAHLDDIGVLSERATLAHAVWVTDDDIERLARAGSSVAHNAISNQKLGAGIAPFRKLRDAGVNLALGTDGVCSNDTPRMFDVMKAAGLLHKVTSPDHTMWPSAPEVLHAATVAGARSAHLADEVGSLEPGKKADLLVLRLDGPNFTPLNNVANQLVYCEDGSSIEQVMVNGRVVVDGGRLTTIDEDEVLAELRAHAPEFLERHAEVERINAVFMPHVDAIHARCASRPLGINRYSGDESTWLAGAETARA